MQCSLFLKEIRCALCLAARRVARHRAECIFHQKSCFTALLMRCNRWLLTFQASLVDFRRVFCYAERRKNAKESLT